MDGAMKIYCRREVEEEEKKESEEKITGRSIWFKVTVIKQREKYIHRLKTDKQKQLQQQQQERQQEQQEQKQQQQRQ